MSFDLDHDHYNAAKPGDVNIVVPEDAAVPGTIEHQVLSEVFQVSWCSLTQVLESTLYLPQSFRI
jgi:hypothetical protein